MDCGGIKRMGEVMCFFESYVIFFVINTFFFNCGGK